jgi:hypothetical protein
MCDKGLAMHEPIRQCPIPRVLQQLCLPKSLAQALPLRLRASTHRDIPIQGAKRLIWNSIRHATAMWLGTAPGRQELSNPARLESHCSFQHRRHDMLALSRALAQH